MNLRMTRNAVVTAAALVAAAALAGCGTSGGSSGGSAGPVSISLGTINTPALSDLFLLEHPPAGLKLNQGKAYNLKITSFQSSSDVVQGLAAGNLQAGTVGSVSLMPAIQQGIDLKLVGEAFEERSGYGESDWMVAKNSGITNVSQLKGKSIAVLGIGTPIYWIAKAYLADHGLTENKDYKFVALPFAAMAGALTSGKVAMAGMAPPYSTKALKTGNVKPLFVDTDEQNPFVQTLLGVTSQFASANPAATKALMEDWQTVSTYAAKEENRQAMLQATSTAVKLPTSDLSFLRTRDDYYYPVGGKVDAAALQANWNWYKAAGGTSANYNVKDYLFAGSSS